MIYLSGAIHDDLAGVENIGFLHTPSMGNRVRAGISWGADTGCYAQGDKFVLTKYLDWLWDNRRHAPECLFATAPDVVGDPLATWERSRDVLPWVRALGYPAALVGQDGLEHLPIEWDAFDAYFVGGSTAWKLSEASAAICREAKARGKWVHVGRTNSLKRLQHGDQWMCADSADGTFVAFGPDKNIPRLLGWMEAINTSPALDLWAPAGKAA